MTRLSAIVLVLLAGCMTEGPTPRQQANQWALANATPAGPAEDCVTLNRIRRTIVRDDSTIDFVMIDGRVMRNRLPNQCPGLAFDERFLYRTSLDRLCSTDIITVILPDGGRGPTCGLGTFQPVSIAPR